MKSPATLGIIATVIIGGAFLGLLIASRTDEIKNNTDVAILAEELGLDVEKFVTDYEGAEVKSTVKAHYDEGVELMDGQLRTPTVFYKEKALNIGTLEAEVAELIAEASEENSEVTLPLELKIFEDFNCPHCASFQPQKYNLEQVFGDDIEIIDMQMPFLKENSEKFALAAEAARLQGRYDDYSVELFMRIHGKKYNFYTRESGFIPVSFPVEE